VKTTLKGLRVLLAEDNVVKQGVAMQQLKELSCCADPVGSGEEMLAAFSTVPYDLVLMRAAPICN
jgi:CheY-like chemotaxis protein